MTDFEKSKQDLLFGVRRSIRYHIRRCRFFDRLNKTTKVLTAFAGSATLISAISKLGDEWTIVFAAFVAIFATIDLVFSTSQSARNYQDLSRRFIQLEKKIYTMKPEDLEALTAERLDIEADEPPPLRVLDSICHNELRRAMGFGPDGDVRIRWYQRWFAQFFDIREHIIR